MNTPTDNTPQPEPRPRKRPRGGGGENASGKGAQNARELAHWNHSRVPSASELLAIGELFQGMTPHRMKLHQLALLREHVLAYRIRCGHPEIDAFMAACTHPRTADIECLRQAILAEHAKLGRMPPGGL